MLELEWVPHAPPHTQDEKWVNKRFRPKQKPGEAQRDTDAVLNCPACFTTLCFDCQRCVVCCGCDVCELGVPAESNVPCVSHRAHSRTHAHIQSCRHAYYKNQYRAMFVQNCTILTGQPVRPVKGDTDPLMIYHTVACGECGTEVGVYDMDEIFHFSNVTPGN